MAGSRLKAIQELQVSGGNFGDSLQIETAAKLASTFQLAG